MKLQKKYFSLDYLISFFLVMSGGSVAFVFNRNVLTLLLFTLVLSGLVLNHQKVKKDSFRLSIISLVILLVFLVVNFLFGVQGQSFVKFGFIFLSFLIAVMSLMYFEATKKSIIDVFRGILLLVMYHSLINFFAYPFIKSGLSVITNPFNEYTCSTFHYLLYYMPSRNELGALGDLFCRNQGLFWEPGVLQIFLNLLFFIDAFVRKTQKKLTVWLTILAIILTYSSTGIIILAIQLVVFFWAQLKRNILIAPVLIALTIPFYQLLEQNLEYKIVGEGSTSAQVRMFDLVQQAVIAIDNPVTGLGLDDQIYKTKRSEYSVNIAQLDYESLEKGSSNSVLFLMAAGGFPFALYILYSFFKQTLIRKQKILFISVFLLSVMSEPVLLKPFFLLFVMTGTLQLLRRLLW